MPTFQFSKPEDLQKPAAPVTPPVRPSQPPQSAPEPPVRSEGADMRDAALGGSGGSSSTSVDSEPESLDARQVRRPVNKPASNIGRRGKSDVDSTSVVRIPASMAAYAREKLNGVASRSDAVSACLYALFAFDENPPDVPDELKSLSEQIEIRPNSDLDLHTQLESMQREIVSLTGVLKSTYKALLETQSAVIWLLGEKLNSPGADVKLGSQHVNIAFADAELLRHRLAVQTREREVELQTKRGREIEEDKFRKSQREKR